MDQKTEDQLKVDILKYICRRGIIFHVLDPVGKKGLGDLIIKVCTTPDIRYGVNVTGVFIGDYVLEVMRERKHNEIHGLYFIPQEISKDIYDMHIIVK